MENKQTDSSAQNTALQNAAQPVGAPAESEGNPFKRNLSVFSMVIYGLIFMVPIAPMAIYGDVFEASNGMPALAYMIGFIAVLFSVFSFAVMIRRFPSSGSIYTYASHSIGRAAGFITGWLMLLQYLTTPTLMYIIAGTALHGMIPEVDTVVWCIMMFAIVAVVSMIGIGATMKIDRIALIAEIVVLALFLIFGFKYMAEHSSTSGPTMTALFDASKFDLKDIMSAVSLAVLSYVGFGVIATLTQQAKDEKNGPPRAMMIMSLLLVVLFALQCYVATCVDPSGSSFKGNEDNGFYTIAQTVGGAWLSVACAVAVALSQGIFTALAAQTSVSLIMFSMAKGGGLPEKLGTLKKGTNTPLIANIVVLIITFGLLFVMLPLGVSEVAKVSNFGALATYTILNVCVIVLCFVKLKERKGVFRFLIFPAIGAAVCGYILFSLSSVALITGAIWTVVGIVYYCIVKYGMHRNIKVV